MNGGFAHPPGCGGTHRVRKRKVFLLRIRLRPLLPRVYMAAPCPRAHLVFSSSFSPPFVSLCLLHLGYARRSRYRQTPATYTRQKASRIRRSLGPKPFAQSCEWELLVTKRQRTRGGFKLGRMDGMGSWLHGWDLVRRAPRS